MLMTFAGIPAKFIQNGEFSLQNVESRCIYVILNSVNWTEI